MNKTGVDPSRLEGDALDRWYRRTPDEIAEERRQAEQDRHEAFFGDLAFLEPPLRPPMTRSPVRPPPLRPGLAEPRLAPAGAEGSFFGSFPPLPDSSDYLTPLPPPLNRVEGSVVGSDFYALSDHTIVSGDELERIYAEQQRRVRGQELAPSPYARAVDRLQDGKVPRAGQLGKGMWERDPTCHPYGGWEVDPGFRYYPKRTQDYEEQITGARGVDYVVRIPGRKKPVKFDGCDVVSPSHPLQEAKGPGYAGLLERAWRSTFGRFVTEGLQRQATRQGDVAEGRPVIWSIAEEPAVNEFHRLVKERRVRFTFEPAKR
jgi:hypothetical protein